MTGVDTVMILFWALLAGLSVHWVGASWMDLNGNSVDRY